MPPKVKTTREEILDAAVVVIRDQGVQALNARTIAALLNCSTQPIFSNFATMEELRLAVVEKADAIYGTYIQREVEAGEFPVYKATGMAYIRFAKEERELFKLLYMRDRTNEPASGPNELDNQIEAVVQKNTGLDKETAWLFHLEMWAYVHGVASMVATGYFELDFTLVSRMLTDAYQGLRKQYGME